MVKGLWWLTTVFMRLSRARYDCLPDVSISPAYKTDALNHFGLRSGSFKLLSIMSLSGSWSCQGLVEYLILIEENGSVIILNTGFARLLLTAQ